MQADNTVKANDGAATGDVDYGRVLELALEIGVGLLSSGGSVSRVETAVDRICSSFGAFEVNVAAFPSMVIASVRTRDDREFSFMKRVYSSMNNLAMLEKFNQLSRDICAKRTGLEEGFRRAFDIAHNKPRDKRLTVLGAGLVRRLGHRLPACVHSGFHNGGTERGAFVAFAQCLCDDLYAVIHRRTSQYFSV